MQCTAREREREREAIVDSGSVVLLDIIEEEITRVWKIEYRIPTSTTVLLIARQRQKRKRTEDRETEREIRETKRERERYYTSYIPFDSFIETECPIRV